MVKLYKVTLYNQFAQCEFCAVGRYPLAAYRAAVVKARPVFTTFRGKRNGVDEIGSASDYDVLWADVLKSWKARHIHGNGASVHVGQNGLGVELRKGKVHE